jgi:Ribbon-helix-helix protein, copG family
MTKGARGLVSKYASLNLGELQEATKEFDREMIVAKSRPLRPAERQAWEKARRKPGRPRRGAGVKVISVSVEKDLLARSDVLARALGISRASLIERGLKAVLTAGGRR